jgi:hypothetical protein
MRCDQVRSLLDDYVERSLPDVQTDRVARHLRDCAACRREEWGLRALPHEAAGLPSSIEPARDLWAGIAERVDREERLPGFPPAERRAFAPGLKLWVAAAAAAAVVIAVGLGVALRFAGRAGEPIALAPEAPFVEPAGAPIPVAATPAALSEAEVAFRTARGELRAIIEERRRTLSPRTIQAINENLEIIDAAVREIQEALVKDPGNRELKRMLIATQERQVAFLRHVAQTAALR